MTADTTAAEPCPECDERDGRAEFEGHCSATCRDNAGERQYERRYGGAESW